MISCIIRGMNKKGVNMDEDISNKTVAVLLLLAIVLSITGTWLALTMEPVVVKYGPTEDSETGRVGLQVGFDNTVVQPSEPSVKTGEITFEKLN